MQSSLRRFEEDRSTTFSLARQGKVCPECSVTEGITDNGEDGPFRTYRCDACDCQWDRTFGTEG